MVLERVGEERGKLNRKITFTNKGQNAAAVNAGTHFVIEDRRAAEVNNNLPHNGLVITNQDTLSTLFIFLDNFADQDVPDYVMFPEQTMVLNLDDGVSFTTVFVKNTHATNNIAAKAIKYKVTTIRDERDL